MRILVTGSLGLVGRDLVGELVDAGNEVVGYNRDYSHARGGELVLVQGELFDIPRLVTAMNDYEVEAVVHTAAMSHPGLSVDMPLTTSIANAHGTVCVFEAARLAHVRIVVNFSSECVYGNLPLGVVVSEGTPTHPSTPYGATKVYGELMGHVYSSLYEVTVTSLRVTEVYGPGLWMPSIISDLVTAALDGVPFRLASGADHPFQFVYVRDVARAATLTLQANRLPQSIYNITGGTQMLLREAAEVVRSVLPSARIELGPGFLPGWDRQGPFDITAARRDLSYSPSWSFEAGLKAYADWVQSVHHK